MVSREAVRAVVGAALTLALGGGAACVLADPPADLPVTPLAPPEILREDVQPPDSILQTFPSQFVVPVAADPRAGVLGWQFSVDQVPVLRPPSGQEIPADGGVLLVFNPTQTPDAQECHTLELIVSYPDDLSVPGDSVTWFYFPTNSVTNCPVFDAGPLDAGPDGDASGNDGAGSAD
jgi:hypothetical protein